MAAGRRWTALFAQAVRAMRWSAGSLSDRLLRYSEYHRRPNYTRPNLSMMITASAVARCLSFFSTSNKSLEQESQNTAKAKIAKTLAKADDLYDDQRIDELLVLLQASVAGEEAENDEVLWRLARAFNEKSKRVDNKLEKQKLLCEAFEIIKKALAVNDKNFACHKWYAILMDKVAEFEGTKARISGAFEVKKHFMKASELNPRDATTLYTLGVWCFLFADMPWYQRKIASALFATPPTSTYEEALQYFHRAEEMEPNFYSKNLLMLGKTYSRLGNKDLAGLYLTRAVDFPVKTPDDRDAHKEAEDLLKKLGISVDKKQKTYM